MAIQLRLELKDEGEVLDGIEPRSPDDITTLVVEVIEQITLGRGEDEVLTRQFDDQSSDSEFNRQMALLKNPHVDLTPFYAHERGVSRKHARIRIRNMRLSVLDLGSTNGTYVNNHMLEPNIEYPIKEGDELRLGFLTLTLSVV